MVARQIFDSAKQASALTRVATIWLDEIKREHVSRTDAMLLLRWHTLPHPSDCEKLFDQKLIDLEAVPKKPLPKLAEKEGGPMEEGFALLNTNRTIVMLSLIHI